MQLVTLGIGFCSLPQDFPQLVDFATKYLRKNSSLRVGIYGSLLGCEEEIAILVKICFSLNTIYNYSFSPHRLFLLVDSNKNESNESIESFSLLLVNSDNNNNSNNNNINKNQKSCCRRRKKRIIIIMNR